MTSTGFWDFLPPPSSLSLKSILFVCKLGGFFALPLSLLCRRHRRKLPLSGREQYEKKGMRWGGRCEPPTGSLTRLSFWDGYFVRLDLEAQASIMCGGIKRYLGGG